MLPHSLIGVNPKSMQLSTLHVIIDINECARDLGVCNQSSSVICINTIGGFTCECAEGYLDQKGICEGITNCARETE